ncbi:MAG TPA: hypothetical protein VGJ18_01290 [Gemmatimonadaceae bacterium]|jgi:hypothetical protein
MPRLSDEVKAPGRYAQDTSSSGRRLEDVARPRERRSGPSRLSTWTGRRVVVTGIVWVGLMLVLVALAAFVSFMREGTAEDVRLAFTRSNFIGLGATLVIPPVCLTAQWWRMRSRRRASGT